MKILLKYNEKFVKIPVKKVEEVISKYDESNVIGGIEIEVGDLKPRKIEYYTELAKVLSVKKKILQIRGVKLSENIFTHYDHLKLYAKLAEEMGQKLTVIYTPLVLADLTEAVYKTNVILKRILKNIKDNGYNLEVVVENIDEYKSEFTPFNLINVLKIIPEVKFSFSIGNNYLKENSEYKLNRALEKKLQTITLKNISDINSLRYVNIDFDKLFYYLNEIKFKKNIVLAIDFLDLKGDNIEDKIISYILEVEKLQKIIQNYSI